MPSAGRSWGYRWGCATSALAHDYKRHGTITLFAALNHLDGKILSRTEKPHTLVEWLRFLKPIERDMPRY
jgi:hypothetical protein